MKDLSPQEQKIIGSFEEKEVCFCGVCSLVNGGKAREFLLSTIREVRAGADAPIEHCAEPKCPACNLAAYHQGRADGLKAAVAEVKRITELYRKTQFGLDDEILLHLSRALEALSLTNKENENRNL